MRNGGAKIYNGEEVILEIEENAKRIRSNGEEIDRAKKIAHTADFKELTDGYYRTVQEYYVKSCFNCRKRKEVVTEWIEMDKPRLCNYPNFSIVSSVKSTMPAPEYRGITLRQLWAIEANIVRRCTPEKWTNNQGEILTPDTVTLYDIDKYIIRPFTVGKRESFITCLPSTAGIQPPMFFVKHWWGESMKEFVMCIVRFIQNFAEKESSASDEDSGDEVMTVDTPIWIGAYANNTWEINEDATEDAEDSLSIKALKVTQGRSITIIDKELVCV